MQVDSQRTEPTRVQDLWFDDGNLIIQAGNSQYRVYRGILAKHSPIFQDVFSFPQPPDSELVDGCPVVRLTDAEEEVTSFLNAIFNPTFFRPFPSSTEFSIIVGCLRLSHKYEVDYLRRRALIHLSSVYRTKLSEVDTMGLLELEDYSDDSEPLPSPSEIYSWSFYACPKARVSISAIRLAREIDAPWILPYAFYNLTTCYYHYSRRLDGDPPLHDIPLNLLSAQDQQSFASGHCKQLVSSVVDILRFLYHPLNIDGCTSPHECVAERLRTMERNRKNLQTNAALPLEVWELDDWKSLENLCPACFLALRKTHADARQAFWDGLPEMYDLPPWEELEKLKADAIGTNLFC
ncbi:hypothetical protein C8R45DRAFT_863701 [Mycena sanguinolenta]|nr:hypothetical protein C8R45DRAFT_863701 [Mycena sanguinolenta]